MKTIKQQNMDLDLRRFGHNLYTEALNSGNGEGEEGSGKISINEGLKRVYKELFDGYSQEIQFPDAYVHSEGGDEYVLIEDDFVALVENFAEDIANNGRFAVYPVYKNPPYESETKYEVKDSDKLCLLRPENVGMLDNAYMFFLTTMPTNVGEKYYDTNRIDVSTESGTEPYYTLSIWQDEK